MTPSQVVVEGTLKPDGTLELDGKPGMPPGRVRIILESLSASPQPGGDWWEVLERIWKEQAASGHEARAREEIDAEMSGLRAEWEERLQELEKIHEAAHRPPQSWFDDEDDNPSAPEEGPAP